MITVVEITKNVDYPLNTYVLSDDKSNLFACLGQTTNKWLHYDPPLKFYVKGRQFKIIKNSCKK